MEQKIMRPNMAEHYYFYNMRFPLYRQFMLVPIGSWNYNCANEHSDVDTKAIFIPSIYDVIEDKCESYTYFLPNEEHISCHDIRNYMKGLIKGNPQFLETFFTKWGNLNTEYYGEEVHYLMHMREDIARCNPNNTMRAFLGLADRNYKLTVNRSEENHFSKQVYQLTRIEECMDKYRKDKSFEECLVTDRRDFLLSIKNNEFSKESLEVIAYNCIQKCHNHYDNFILMNSKEDTWTQHKVEQIVIQVMQKSIEKFDK